MARQRQCPLVNPACPDDLCVLPAAHASLHQLQTMVEPGEVWDGMFLMSGNPRIRTLIDAGYRASQKLADD